MFSADIFKWGGFERTFEQILERNFERNSEPRQFLIVDAQTKKINKMTSFIKAKKI